MTLKQIIYRLNRRDLPLFNLFSSTIKILIVVIIAFFAIVTTKNIIAAETPVKNPIKEKQDAMLSGNNQEAWLDAALGSNAMSLNTVVSGTLPDEVLNGEIDPNTVYIPGGLIGITNHYIAATYTPTASGIEYVAELKNSFLGKPAYAANDTGFNGLKPIMSLWKTFRNVVYVLISFYFIILGIMIMLRVKVSPQAVVTIQSSLPKVITTLVLVTFSYAIAGFCIDLINVFQALSISLIFNGAGKGLDTNLFPISWKQWSLGNLFNWLSQIWGGDYFRYDYLNNANFWMVKDLIHRLAPNTVTLLLGGVIGGVIASMAGPVAGLIGMSVGAIVLNLIISLIIIVYMFKFAFALSKTYITVILQIIFSPFLIFIGIFPSSKKGFSDWLLNLVGHLAVFPVGLLFLILANLICDSLGGQGLGGISTPLWSPLLVGGPFKWFLPTIVGISAIAMLSKIPQIVPEAIFGLKPSPLGKAIGEGFKSLPGAGTIGNVRSGMQKQFQEDSAGKIKKWGKEGLDKVKELDRSDSNLGKGYRMAQGMFGNLDKIGRGSPAAYEYGNLNIRDKVRNKINETQTNRFNKKQARNNPPGSTPPRNAS